MKDIAAVISCDTFYYYAVQGGSKFCVCGWNFRVFISMKAIELFFFLSFDMYTIIYLLYLVYRVQMKLSIQINSSNTFIHSDALYCAVNWSGSNFQVSGKKVLEQKFLASTLLLFIIRLYRAALRFESVGEIFKCDHSNESYWAVLSCDVEKVVISTLASVNKAPNERYRVSVSFDTLCQMNFGNTKIKLSSWWYEITLEKLTWVAPLRCDPSKFAVYEKYFSFWVWTNCH